MRLKAFIVATLDGRMPSMPVKNHAVARDNLVLCRKGWPYEVWRIYEIGIENKQPRVRTSVPSIFLDVVGEENVRETLRTEMSQRFPGQFNIV